MVSYENGLSRSKDRNKPSSTASIKQGSILGKLADLLYDKNGSDIIINSNSKPAIKVDGKVIYVGNKEISSDNIKDIVISLMSKKQWDGFLESNEMNLMVSYSRVAHFRVNVLRQRGDIGIVLRLVPFEVPNLDKLQLPNILKDFAILRRGLVLFSGATDAGKSTSLAAMIDYRNSMVSDHIITIEDPIEFIHSNKRSMVIQREVGVDTDSYSIAMKSALRQSPNAILIGEIRDQEVMEQALAFAETGHMVFATVHATSATLTLERIVNMFPRGFRDKLMIDLSNNIKAIVTQRLLPRITGKGRVASLEIMSNTPHIGLLIRESRLKEIPTAMEKLGNKTDDIITNDNYIFNLYEDNKIKYEDALLFVDSPNNFRVRLRSDSSLPLPEELKTDNKSWEIETAIDDSNKADTYGSFSR